MKHVIIFAVASDTQEKSGKLEIGPDSETVCFNAICKSRYWTQRGVPNVIVLCAGMIPGTGVVLSKLMRDHILENCPELESKIITLKADKFNTEGEVAALFEWLRTDACTVGMIMVLVRWWHARRVIAWIRLYSKPEFSDLEVIVVRCCSIAPLLVRLKEYLLAWPYNWVRMQVFKCRHGHRRNHRTLGTKLS